MRRSPAPIALLGMLLSLSLSLPLQAAPPERVQFNGTSYRLAWNSEASNDYQPDEEAGRGHWRRMISFKRLPAVRDMAGLRAEIGRLAGWYAQHGTRVAQTCHDAAPGRPAECTTLVRDALQGTRDGMFVATAVYRFVLDRDHAVQVMIGWRTYGMDAIERDRAYVESPAGRAAIREALAWHVPLDAAPTPLTAKEKAASRDGLLRALGECHETRSGHCR